MIKTCNKLTKDKIRVLEEKSRKLIINNSSLASFNAFKVDGCYKTTGNKCDYLVEITDKLNVVTKVYYVELKGCRLSDALEQLLETINYCLSIHSEKNKIAIAILSRVPQITTGIQAYQKKMKNMGIECIIKSSIYTVSI